MCGNYYILAGNYTAITVVGLLQECFSTTEHILLKNTDGSYDIAPYFEVKTSIPTLSAWVFEKEKPYAVLWDNEGECEITLKLENVRLGSEYFENDIPFEKNGNTVRVKVSSRRYLTADTDLDGLISALKGV